MLLEAAVFACHFHVFGRAGRDRTCSNNVARTPASSAMLSSSPNFRLHFATAWMCVLTTAWAFKTGDFPFELVKSTNSTITREANEIIAKNMAADMGIMNDIPDPALMTENTTDDDINVTSENATSENKTKGIGGLGRSPCKFQMGISLN